MSVTSQPLGKSARCLAVLAEGPALTGEVAIETGLSPHLASTHLHNLLKRGKVIKRPFHQPTEAGSGQHHLVSLWSLTEGYAR